MKNEINFLSNFIDAELNYDQLNLIKGGGDDDDPYGGGTGGTNTPPPPPGG